MFFIFHSQMSQRHEHKTENGIMTGFGLTNFFNRFFSSSIHQFCSHRSYSLLASQTITVADVGNGREWEMGNMKKLAQCRWWSKVHCGSKRDVLEVMKTLSLLRSHIEMNLKPLSTFRVCLASFSFEWRRSLLLCAYSLCISFHLMHKRHRCQNLFALNILQL